MHSQVPSECTTTSALGPSPTSGHDPDVAAKRSSGPSGVHQNPQRLLSQEPEAWEEQDKHWKKNDYRSWAEWARFELGEAIRRARGKK
jgi:hypothetical protein